jgi:hypothetical protein
LSGLLAVRKGKASAGYGFQMHIGFLPGTKVPRDSDFDGGKFLLKESQRASHFNCERAICPKKDGRHATVNLDDLEQLGEVLWDRDYLFLGGLDFI